MPRKLIKHVRSLIKPKTEEAAVESHSTPEPEKRAPKAARKPRENVAPSKPAPKRSGETEEKPRGTRESEEGAKAPAERTRAKVTAEGTRGKTRGEKEALPEPLRKVKQARSREAQSEEWRPKKRRSPKTGEKKERQGGEEKPRRRRRPREEGGGGRRSSEGSSPRREVSPSRGKGFSFPRPKRDHGDWDRSAYRVESKEGKIRFTDVELGDELLHAISDLGYEYCTPIQAEILPSLLAGRDGLGQAQTGTGKTAAFLLASFNRMLQTPRRNPPNGAPRMLVVAPTRELVLQIEEEAAELAKYTPFQTLPVYGGLDFEAQKDALRGNTVDMVAATPGRLLDFMRKKVVNLSQVETLVLDEADRMLDMGFIPDVKRIVYATPHKDKRQTLFFSATFSDDVRRLAESWTRDPVSVVIEPESVAADTVDQKVYIVTDEQKFPLTVNLLRELKPRRCLIFANRRDSSEYLCDRLKDYEFSAALLTGAVPQAKRVRVLEEFKNGTIPILVATDVAGRGIHVEDVDLVINFNLPEDAEDYVHRIGRTGRAGQEGKSICFADEMDAMLIPDIEKFLGKELVCTHPDEAHLTIEKRERHHAGKRRERRRDTGGGRGGPRGRGGSGRGGPRGGTRGGSGGGGRGGPRGGGGRRR